MKTIYYNKHEFTKACAFLNTNPLEAKRLLEEYFLKYPKDLTAKPYYIYVLIVLGKFKEAREYFNQLKNDLKNNNQFDNQNNKQKYLNNSLLLSELRLLAREKNYQEFLKKAKSVPLNFDSEQLTFYCKQKLKLRKEPRTRSSYMYNQIIEYREEDFLSYIQKHTADYNMNLDNPNPCIFTPDFPLEEIVEEVKKRIPSNDRLCYGFFEDTYVFQYDDCGRVENRPVDFFKVIAFDQENSGLITMYPAKECEELPSINLNYMAPKTYQKKKTLSQIEKFNRRYKR